MKQNCQHCEKLILGNAYRVTSEDAGIALLNMIVCHHCFMEAKRLGLHAQKVNVENKQPSARNRMSHRPSLHI
jgi:RNase P subunit RPR2